jgi:hypothetical protein
MTASDAAEWWEKNREYTAEWSRRSLGEFVDAHPNFFAVVVATTAQTVIEAPMAIGSGFVDMLNLGKGAAEGGWGFLQDGLRLVGVVTTAARGAQMAITQVLAAGRLGNCAWIAAAKALMQTGTRPFCLVGDLARAAGARGTAGVQSVQDLLPVLQKVGANVRMLNQPSNVVELIGATQKNTNGVLMFGLRWKNARFAGPGNPDGGAGHALLSYWDSAKGFLIVDRSGKVVKTLSELESLYPGIGSAQLSGGLMFIEKALVPQAALMKAAVTGSLLDAFALEMKVVFSPPPEVAEKLRRGPSVEIGEPVIVRRTITWQAGDWLSKISQREYQEKAKPELLWPIIHDANREAIGKNPNVVKPGIKLTIPDISAYSEAQLAEIRKRGLNWRQY